MESEMQFWSTLRNLGIEWIKTSHVSVVYSNRRYLLNFLLPYILILRPLMWTILLRYATS